MWQGTLHRPLKATCQYYDHVVKRKIKGHKEQTWNSILEDITSDPHALWNATRRLTRRYQGIPTLSHNGTQVIDDKDKANIFARKYEQQFTPNYDMVDARHRILNRVVEEYTSQLEDANIDNDAPTFTTQ
ncbi:hypothetical protein JGG58_23640 [Salmonella enterica subsp. enterica serovar London]|nr:hypothetical protein [Salmonella enterica subsp. enterica serovar London]